jgi:molybdenum cofactor cytidylyltransferase
MSRPAVAGLILAAGASRRMGSPKPLLDLGGETFLDRLIGVFRPVCTPVIVVLGYHAELIRAGIRRAAEVKFVVNPQPERGQLSSLKCGLRALPLEVEAVLFMPVDYPRVRASTVQALAAALDRAAPSDSVIIPRYGDKHGHPVCAKRDVIAALLDLPDDATARDVIQNNAKTTLYVEVDDPGILRDIDDPETYRQELALDKRPLVERE